MNKKELILALNEDAKKSHCLTVIDDYEVETEEDFPILTDFADNNKLLKSEFSISRHRWYEIVTHICEYEGYTIAVKQIGKMYSENMEKDDVDTIVKFFPVREIPSVSYEYEK